MRHPGITWDSWRCAWNYYIWAFLGNHKLKHQNQDANNNNNLFRTERDSIQCEHIHMDIVCFCFITFVCVCGIMLHFWWLVCEVIKDTVQGVNALNNNFPDTKMMPQSSPIEHLSLNIHIERISNLTMHVPDKVSSTLQWRAVSVGSEWIMPLILSRFCGPAD